MKTSRRGFFGLVGGAAVAAVVPVKDLVGEPRREIAAPPPVKFDRPYMPGDVLEDTRTHRLYVVKAGAHLDQIGRRSDRVLGMRGTGGWEASPDSLRYTYHGHVYHAWLWPLGPHPISEEVPLREFPNAEYLRFIGRAERDGEVVQDHIFTTRRR